MRAVIVEEPGDVEALTIKETPTPTPQPGEVLVRTVAAGVNRADLLQRLARGLAPPVGLQCGFQFPPRTDARKPQGMRACHDLLHALPMSRTAW